MATRVAYRNVIFRSGCCQSVAAKIMNWVILLETHLRNLFAFVALACAVTVSSAAGLPEIEVWKDPDCGCCSKWVGHLRESGFPVIAHDTASVAGVRVELGMPQRYAACHSARVGSYVIEGHVPASDIKRLLTERPVALGVAVPGMPLGSPGMEGPYSESYQTLLVDQSGDASVFANH